MFIIYGKKLPIATEIDQFHRVRVMEEQVFNIRLHVQGVELEEGGAHNSYQSIRGGRDQGHQGRHGRYLERCHLPPNSVG